MEAGFRQISCDQFTSSTVSEPRGGVAARGLERVVYSPDQDITEFLTSDDYPEFELQFRHDLAVLWEKVKYHLDGDYAKIAERCLVWFAETIFEYRWVRREILPPVYSDLRSKVEQCVRGEEGSVEANKKILSEIVQWRKDNLASIDQAKTTTYDQCQQAVFPTGDSGENKSARHRLLGQFKASSDSSLAISVLDTVRYQKDKPGETVYSVLGEYYFWIETEKGHCRCPELKDVLLLPFFDKSEQSFRTLVIQAISEPKFISVFWLERFLGYRWFVNQKDYDLSKNTQIVSALNARLDWDSGLKSRLVECIGLKKWALKDFTTWCLEPEVVEASLRNQLCNGLPVLDQMQKLSFELLKQLTPEFYRLLGSDGLCQLVARIRESAGTQNLAGIVDFLMRLISIISAAEEEEEEWALMEGFTDR